jgi:hypothetical protein
MWAEKNADGKWEPLRHDVKRWVTACFSCQTGKPHGTRLNFAYGEPTPVRAPFATCEIDVVGPLEETASGNHFIVSFTARSSCRAIWARRCATHCSMRCRCFGIIRHTTAPDDPQGVAIDERVYLEIGNAICTLRVGCLCCSLRVTRVSTATGVVHRSCIRSGATRSWRRKQYCQLGAEGASAGR